MFAEGRDVIVEGKYENGQRLIAKTIMTRCPSKYEPEKPETQAKATNP
jgi:cytochrome c-type biogenesis protein CcmE